MWGRSKRDREIEQREGERGRREREIPRERESARERAKRANLGQGALSSEGELVGQGLFNGGARE